MRALRRRGLRVPDDVSVVGFDDVALSAYVDPPLTTIAQSTAEMGRWAVEQLTGAVRDRDGITTAAIVLLPVRLQARGSSGPAPAD
jgi:LacI family repressor for deo operon, udp, cdd, tsx, nupC, and nupG